MTMNVSSLVGRLLAGRFIGSSTRIYVRDFDLKCLFQGDYGSADLERFCDCRLDSFSWQDGDELYIDLCFGEGIE